jgi:hypothetical protein
MHTEHTDGVRLNELSGLVIGCAFTVLGRRPTLNQSTGVAMAATRVIRGCGTASKKASGHRVSRSAHEVSQREDSYGASRVCFYFLRAERHHLGFSEADPECIRNGIPSLFNSLAVMCPSVSSRNGDNCELGVA